MTMPTTPVTTARVVVTIETACTMIKGARHQSSSQFGGSMRTFWSCTLLPLGLLVGCGPGRHATPAEAPPPPRDLTTPLASSTPMQVVSSREVIRAQPARRTRSRAPRAASRTPAPPVVSESPAPEPVLVAPIPPARAPIVTPVAWKGGAAALEPGQTVTMVPAEAGPTPAPEEGPAPLRERRGGIIRAGGGGCQPHGGRRGGSVFRLTW